ncbi:hypothetical protein HMPREF1568_0734 [Providencia alcalifaciens PAL-3]|nr:hypothetical protein HMPREF1568_0734 [Providencia alcalifaciens PAL-3]EUD01273.1 hypothetical protein HMPREF1566_3323 [Providencia alcalifaciens PAL-1]
MSTAVINGGNDIKLLFIMTSFYKLIGKNDIFLFILVLI